MCVLTTLVLASARTSGMMASVSSAWAASSKMMWVKVPGLRREDTLLELERVVTMISASTRSWNVTRKSLVFTSLEFRRTKCPHPSWILLHRLWPSWCSLNLEVFNVFNLKVCQAPLSCSPMCGVWREENKSSSNKRDIL